MELDQSPLNTPQGPWAFVVIRDGEDGSWVAVEVEWAGDSNTEPQGGIYNSFAINTCKGARRQQLAERIWDLEVSAAGIKQGSTRLTYHQVSKWSDMRRLVLEAYALHATAFSVSSSRVRRARTRRSPGSVSNERSRLWGCAPHAAQGCHPVRRGQPVQLPQVGAGSCKPCMCSSACSAGTCRRRAQPRWR